MTSSLSPEAMIYASENDNTVSYDMGICEQNEEFQRLGAQAIGRTCESGSDRNEKPT